MASQHQRAAYSQCREAGHKAKECSDRDHAAFWEYLPSGEFLGGKKAIKASRKSNDS